MSGQNNYKCTGIINDENKCVDLYIPRKCEVTNRIIDSKDHSSIQLNFAEVFKLNQVGADGKATGKKETLVFSGFVRQKGLSDVNVERIMTEKGCFVSE